MNLRERLARQPPGYNLTIGRSHVSVIPLDEVSVIDAAAGTPATAGVDSEP